MNWNPGGPDAVANGCSCSAESNHRGEGEPAPNGPRFYVAAGCPVHDRPAAGGASSGGTPEGDWAIVEISGRRRFAGLALDVEVFGARFVRIDVPREDGGFTRHFFSGRFIFAIEPTDEARARRVAARERERREERRAARAASAEPQDVDDGADTAAAAEPA